MSARKPARRAPRRPARPRAAARPKPQDLMREAILARRGSHSPYSRFAVGAAVLGESGRIYHGANIENASFGLTCCAERTAIFKAVTEGERGFVAIAVTARDGQGAPPCGACRQVMAEFAPDLEVHWRDRRGRILTKHLSVLLPDQFEFVRRKGRSR